jgi:hypothetical protein
MSLKHFILLIGISILFLGCDAYRAITVVNKSKNTIDLITDFPQTTSYIKDSSGNYIENIIFLDDLIKIKEKYKNNQVDFNSKGLIIRLKPSQTFRIAGQMGVPFVKIQPADLNFSQLTICTMTDTIKANNKQEILDLLENEKTKYIKRLDKKELGIGTKYYKFLIVRQ